MRTRDIKIKQIYLPYLMLSLSILLGYMLLHWVLDMLGVTCQLTGYLIFDYWLLLFVPLFLSIWVMRKRLRLLKLGNAYIFYVVLAFVLVSLPLEEANHFITQAPYRLHHVKKISDIDPNHHVERFYKVDNYKLISEYGVTIPTRSPEGDMLNFALIVPTPIVDSGGILEAGKLYFWYAQEYNLRLPRKGLPDFYYRYRYKEFKDSATKAYTTLNPSRDCYFERIMRSEHGWQETEAVINSMYYVDEDKVHVFRPIYTPFEARYRSSLIYMILWFALGSLFFLISILIPPLDKYAYKRYFKKYYLAYEHEEEESVVKGRGVSQFFIPRKDGLIITPVIIDICVIYFLLLVLAGNSPYGLSVRELDAFGAHSSGAILQGQTWRLLFSAILHRDVSHILGNMLLLASIGVLLERKIGKWAFLLSYLICAFIASITSLLYNYRGTVAAGASGAILGMFGVLLGLLIMDSIRVNKKGAYMMVIINTFIFSILLNTSGGVDVAAHIGGFSCGLGIGIIIPIIMKYRAKMYRPTFVTEGIEPTAVYNEVINAEKIDTENDDELT